MRKNIVDGFAKTQKTVAVLLLIFTVGTPAALADEHMHQDQHTVVRHIEFPSDKSIGALLLVGMETNFHTWPVYSRGKQVASAMGSVTLEVPSDKVLMLDANRRVFENPSLLKQVSPSGIDILRLSFVSLDDREDQMLNRAIPYVSNLKGLKAVYFDRSEAGDIELEKLKNLPHLCAINCFLTSIKGDCFKSFANLPDLSELNVPHCALESKNLIYLSKIHKLKGLDLALTSTDDEGVHSLTNCTELVRLSLSGNPKITDACVKYLLPLAKLRCLDLRGTNVSLTGLKALKSLQLSLIGIPLSMKTHMAEVRSIFPAAAITVDTSPGRASREDKRIYGPLK